MSRLCQKCGRPCGYRFEPSVGFVCKMWPRCSKSTAMISAAEWYSQWPQGEPDKDTFFLIEQIQKNAWNAAIDALIASDHPDDGWTDPELEEFKI